VPPTIRSNHHLPPTLLITRRIARDVECYDYAMPNSDEHRCPNCDSPDFIVIDTKSVADELVECRGCMKLYRLAYQTDGWTRLVQM
jgi:hypothetical protein